MTSEEQHSRNVRRRSLLKGAGALGVAGLAGCIGGGNGNGGGGENVLLFTQVKGWAYPFDPIVANGVPTAQVNGQIYEGLYTYNSDATDMEPQLADGAPESSDDGLEWSVTIRDDATFQNGDDVTAQDVKYSFEAPIEEETENAAELNMIDSIEAVDDKTVDFTLSYPYAAFNITLGWPIVPQSEREGNIDAFGTDPVGSGPFQFVEWSEGDYVLLERWDDYWGDMTPNLDEVEFNFVAEQGTRVTGLETQESDIIETVPPQDYPTVEDMENASIVQELGIGYFYLAFNCNEGPTADPQVREAVDYVFSMDQAVSDYVEPAGVRQYSPFPQSIVDGWDFPADEWSQIPHDKDIDQATQLFEDAGVSMDYEWNIIVPPDDMREQIGTSVSNGLQEVGFNNVTFERLEWGAFLERYATGSEGDYNMYTLGWAGSPDPEAFTYYLFAQELEGSTNGTYYRNDEVDELIVNAREEPDQDTRRQMYIDATTTLLEDRAHLPAYNLYNSYGVQNYVSDYQAHPSSATIPLATGYNNVSVE